MYRSGWVGPRKSLRGWEGPWESLRGREGSEGPSGNPGVVGMAPRSLVGVRRGREGPSEVQEGLGSLLEVL